MISEISENMSIEETRIREAYARRKGDSRYSWFSPGHLFMIQARERVLLSLLKKHRFSSLENKQILEVGCGAGYWLREFMNWGAQPQNITGVDLLVDRVAESRRLGPDLMRIQCANAAELEFPNASFDVVLQSTVFTSVLDPYMKQRIASEMLRVVRNDGLLVWYDYHMNNPRNQSVRGVKKQEIVELFPDCQIELYRTTLAPPVTRFLAPYSTMACSLLEKVKMFNTHYLGVIKKNNPLKSE